MNAMPVLMIKYRKFYLSCDVQKLMVNYRDVRFIRAG